MSISQHSSRTNAPLSPSARAAAKLAAFDPGKLTPSERASWEQLSHTFKAWHEFDQRHPVLRRLAFLPLIGRLYRRARHRYMLTASGKLWN